MPPQVRFTREEIAECAFEIAREKGIEAVTSREVGLRIGCSTRPIFTAFKNMDEVKGEQVHFALKPDKVHIFDKETEERIYFGK